MITVSRLSVAPVKGLRMLHPAEVLVDRGGVADNRRFYLVDAAGRLFAARKHGALTQIVPEYDPDGERLVLRFPDGRAVEGCVTTGESIETDFYGRPVAGQVVEGPWSRALSEFVGKRIRLVRANRPGDACDVHPVSIASTASVEELARHVNGSPSVDSRRFRMLVTVDGCRPHEEDAWANQRVRVGEAAVRVLGPVPRCVTTTLNPDSGDRDLDTLRAIKSYRGLREGRHIDFGVYAEVEEPGRVRLGDSVEPL